MEHKKTENTVKVPLLAKFATEIHFQKIYKLRHRNSLYNTSEFASYPFYKPVSLLLIGPPSDKEE